MARVAVSEETKTGILREIGAAAPGSANIARFPKAKKYIAVAACFAVALLGVLAVTLFGRPPQIGPDPATDGVSTGGYAAEYRSARALSRASASFSMIASRIMLAPMSVSSPKAIQWA